MAENNDRPPGVPECAKQCPKCHMWSGDDWSQCNGACPMPGSPHYKPALADGRTFPVGYVADYAAIEAMVLAHLLPDETLTVGGVNIPRPLAVLDHRVEGERTDHTPHCDAGLVQYVCAACQTNAYGGEWDRHRSLAAAVFKVPYAEVTPEQRQAAKEASFRAVYGGREQTWEALTARAAELRQQASETGEPVVVAVQQPTRTIPCPTCLGSREVLCDACGGVSAFPVHDEITVCTKCHSQPVACPSCVLPFVPVCATGTPTRDKARAMAAAAAQLEAYRSGAAHWPRGEPHVVSAPRNPVLYCECSLADRKWDESRGVGVCATCDRWALPEPTSEGRGSFRAQLERFRPVAAHWSRAEGEGNLRFCTAHDFAGGTCCIGCDKTTDEAVDEALEAAAAAEAASDTVPAAVCKRCDNTGGVLVHGGWCRCPIGKRKRAEASVQTEDDVALGQRLAAEGYEQQSRKYRHVGRPPQAVLDANACATLEEIEVFWIAHYPNGAEYVTEQRLRLENNLRDALKAAVRSLPENRGAWSDQLELSHGAFEAFRAVKSAEMEARIAAIPVRYNSKYTDSTPPASEETDADPK